MHKLDIVQSLVTYSADVLTKNKCLLNQMKKVLMTLHVLIQIEKHPEMFDKVGNVTSKFVKCVLHLSDGDNSIP